MNWREAGIMFASVSAGLVVAAVSAGVVLAAARVVGYWPSLIGFVFAMVLTASLIYGRVTR